MLRVRKNDSQSPFVPDYRAVSIEQIDFEQLKKDGVRYIAFDADSTLVPFRGKMLMQQTREILLKKLDLFDDWCIASNRITDDLQPLADSLGAKVIRAKGKVRKPRRLFFQRVIDHFGTEKPKEIAMIGDKLFADIWGGKRSGLTTVWVSHLGKDSPWDRFLQTRNIERFRYWRHTR